MAAVGFDIFCPKTPARPPFFQPTAAAWAGSTLVAAASLRSARNIKKPYQRKWQVRLPVVSYKSSQPWKVGGTNQCGAVHVGVHSPMDVQVLENILMPRSDRYSPCQATCEVGPAPPSSAMTTAHTLPFCSSRHGTDGRARCSYQR